MANHQLNFGGSRQPHPAREGSWTSASPDLARNVPPTDDAAFARWLAREAGNLLLGIRRDLGHGDAMALKNAGDASAHNLLRTHLARWRPADAVLSEEDDDARLAWSEVSGAAPPDRLSADRVWIVDPLDGTREYSEPQRSDWAVHIALWSRHAPITHRLTAAAVALPAQQRLLGTDEPPPLPERRNVADVTFDAAPIRLAMSRTRPPRFLAALAEDLGAVLVPMGSAGAKIAAVILGDVDGYIHAGGQYEWDSAAPVAVAAAAGLHASRIDGSPLRYNQPDPLQPDLLVCRPEFATRLLYSLRRHAE